MKMNNFWTGQVKIFTLGCILGILGGFMATGFAQGPVESLVQRRPANYIPDDDVIVRPTANEVSFYQRFISSDNSEDVNQLRNQIKIWNDNQLYAEQYGQETSMHGSPYYVPTQEEKWDYFKNKYLRYLRRRGEAPLKEVPKSWYQEYRASNEVDTIDEMEARFKSANKSSQKTQSASSGGNNELALPNALRTKEVDIWKQTKFTFQPRVEQGLVAVGIKSPFAHARAWIGVNGETEYNIQKSYDSIGLRLMFNYYGHNDKYFTSVDQRIMENLYMRYTKSTGPYGKMKDDTLMLLYGRQF